MQTDQSQMKITLADGAAHTFSLPAAARRRPIDVAISSLGNGGAHFWQADTAALESIGAHSQFHDCVSI